MSVTEEQPESLFNQIRREFFINPIPTEPLSEYVGKIQALISILIGNMLEWYIKGSHYTSLEIALEHQLDSLQAETTRLAAKLEEVARKQGGEPQAVKQDDKPPFVIAEDWNLDKITLPFAQPPVFRGLGETLKIVDTDTGGAIRFNHQFIGELHPQGNILALAASIVAAFLNENAVIPKVSPSVTTWEKKVVRWIWHMLLNVKPEECGCKYETDGGKDKFSECELQFGGGRIVAGGTIANLTALFIAREKFRQWCVDSGKLPSEVRPVVLYSGHSHYSLRKAARIVGFVYHKDPLRSEIVRIDGSNYWYVTADDVARAVQDANARGQYVVMVSVLAGATDTGFVDDLKGIAAVISEYNESPNRIGPRIYYHIDGAMGGPFRLLPELKWEQQESVFSKMRGSSRLNRERAKGSLLFEGIESGDAITIDGHKHFYCNYPCGGIFVSRESDFNCLHEDARYLESGESEDEEPEELRRLYSNLHLDESPLKDLEAEWRDRRGLRTLEGSRSIIGITQLYCTLKIFGPEGIKALLKHTLDMTEKLRELIKGTQNQTDEEMPALELITCGPLNQTLFRVVTKWSTRTCPHQLDLDNTINFLIPHFANWTQTDKLGEKLRKTQRGGNHIREIDRILEDLSSIPFYVGTDQLLSPLPSDENDRRKNINAFLDYVWRINEATTCPEEDKGKIWRWQSSIKDPEHPLDNRRSLQVLKAVITHPYTDETVLQKFVNAICEGARFIRKYIENEEPDRYTATPA